MKDIAALRLLKRGHGLVKLLSPDFSLVSNEQKANQHKWDFFCKQLINPNIRYDRRIFPITEATFAFDPLKQETISPLELLDSPDVHGDYEFTAMSSTTLYPAENGLKLFNTDMSYGIGLLFDVQKADLKSERFVFDRDAHTDNDWFLNPVAMKEHNEFRSQKINQLLETINDPAKALDEYNEILAGVNKNSVAAIVLQPPHSIPVNEHTRLLNQVHAIYKKHYIYDILGARHLPIIILPANDNPYEYTLVEQEKDIAKLLKHDPANSFLLKIQEKFKLVKQTAVEDEYNTTKNTVDPITAANLEQIFLDKAKYYQKLYLLQIDLIYLSVLAEENNDELEKSIKAKTKLISERISNIEQKLNLNNDCNFNEQQNLILQNYQNKLDNINLVFEKMVSKIKLGHFDLDTFFMLQDQAFSFASSENQAFYINEFFKNYLLSTNDFIKIDEKLLNSEQIELINTTFYQLNQFSMLINNEDELKEHKNKIVMNYLKQLAPILNKRNNTNFNVLIDNYNNHLIAAIKTVNSLNELDEVLTKNRNNHHSLLSSVKTGKNIVNQAFYATDNIFIESQKCVLDLLINPNNNSEKLVLLNDYLQDTKDVFEALTTNSHKEFLSLDKHTKKLQKDINLINNKLSLFNKILGGLTILLGTCFLAAGLLSLPIGMPLLLIGIAITTKGFALANIHLRTASKQDDKFNCFKNSFRSQSGKNLLNLSAQAKKIKIEEPILDSDSQSDAPLLA